MEKAFFFIDHANNGIDNLQILNEKHVINSTKTDLVNLLTLHLLCLKQHQIEF